MADTTTPTKTPTKELNFGETFAKLSQALQLKLQINELDSLQVKQILTNFRETENYSDIEQYLK